MPQYPDQKVYFNPDENISSQDANFISEFIANVHKAFVTSAMTKISCRISGLGITYTNNSTPSPTVNIASGLAFFVLPDPKNITDPNNYSGAIFSGGDNIGISAPPLSTRSDAIDITYNEQLGNDGGSIGFQSPRDVIDNLGIITANVPLYTRRISNYVVTYIPDYPSFNGGQPATGTVRLATFTVTTAGFCSPPVYVMPSIWENQDWPTGSPDTADQSATLADSLASIRYKLNQIIGSTNWYDSLSGNNILNLLQLGNAPNFWGDTSSGSDPTYNLTIANFPVNASIIPGTIITYKANFTNGGPAGISTNGQASIPLNDATNTPFLGGEIVSGSIYEITYTGTTYQILGNATPVFVDVKTDVINGSFEEWSGGLPVDWTANPTPSNASINRESGSVAADGGNAVRFDLLNSGFAALETPNIPISPYSTYYVQFKTWATTGTINGHLGANFYQADGVTPTASGSTQSLWTAGTYPTSAANGTFYGVMRANNSTTFYNTPNGILVIQIPSDARYVRLVTYAGTNPGSSQSIWFDDVRFFTPTFNGLYAYFPSSGTQSFRTGKDTTLVLATLIGGGGGGGGSQTAANSNSWSGGGGGQGGVIKVPIEVIPDTVYTITIGAGGAGGAAVIGGGNAPAGSPGGNTKIVLNGTTLIEVSGGTGGGGNNNSTQPTDGLGGTLVSYIQNTLQIINLVTGGNGGFGNGPKGGGSEPNGGAGGNATINGEPYLHNTGGTQNSQDGGGGSSAPAGSGAGGAGGALGADNTGGQSGNSGAVIIEF